MKIESLRDLTRDEILQKREELKQELFNLELRKNISELDNPLKLRTLRRDIARIETILTEDVKGIRKIVEGVSLLDSASKKKAADEKAADETENK